MKRLQFAGILFPAAPVIVLIFCVLLAGCGLLGGDTDEPVELLETPETELIPLAVGNYWVYEQFGQ